MTESTDKILTIGAKHGTSTEEALKQSLKELADIKFALDESAIVAITDQRGVITFVNDKFCEISKYSREELLGQDHRIINSRYHPQEFIRNLWMTIAGGRVWRGEIRNRAKDGSHYWVDTTIVPFLNSEGKPYQYVAIRSDITERKRLEAELVRAAQLSLIGELSANLAHEIKNPLAGIQGAVDILIRRREQDDPERAVLEGVRHEIGRIDGTVRALLERARPRALQVAPTTLTEVVHHAVQLARDQAAISSLDGPNVYIEFEPATDELRFPLDAAQIEDAVLNLIINAVEAVEGEGRVTVRVRSRLAVDANNDRGEAVIEVEDNGRGISKDDLPRIFNPFYTTTRGGTGLGLPAARRIARAHGGQLDVCSTPGHGSTFTLRLPLSTPS
jgi:PAS domain S-box-containing protein